MHALVSLSGLSSGPPAATPPGVGVLVLLAAALPLILLGLFRLLRPLLRVRHARLPGVTPEETLLLSGRGRVPPPPPPAQALVGAAVSVLPSRTVAPEPPLELAEEDRELVGLLGPDHPMSAPGRHRPHAAPDGAAPAGPDADTLLSGRQPEPDAADPADPVPPPTVEPASEPGPDVEPGAGPGAEPDAGTGAEPDAGPGADAGPDAEPGAGEPGGRRPGADREQEPDVVRGLEVTTQDDAPVSITDCEATGTESGHMTGSPSGRASDFYGIDWQDDEWRGITLPGAESTAGATEWWSGTPAAPSPDEVMAPATLTAPTLRTLADALGQETSAARPAPSTRPMASSSTTRATATVRPLSRSASAGRGWDDLADVALSDVPDAPALLPVALAPEGSEPPIRALALPAADIPMVPLADEPLADDTGPIPTVVPWPEPAPVLEQPLDAAPAEPEVFEDEALEDESFALEGFEPESFEPESFEPESFEPESFEPDDVEIEAFAVTPLPVEPVLVESTPVESVLVEPAPSEELSDEPVVPGPRPSGQISAAEQNTLHETRARLDEPQDRTTIGRIVTESALSLVDADSVALIVHSTEGPWVIAVTPDGAPVWGPQTLAALISAGGPVRRVVEGDPLLDGGASALLAVPMASAGAWVGTLLARRESPRPFTAAEQGLLDRLARIAGAALDGQTRRGVLRRTDGVDPVTSLAPRNRLGVDLQAALRGSDVHGMPVCLVVAEVDGLARMRSEAGPEQADEALALIADTVASGLRVGDLAYRFDEDVLAVLLAAIEPEDAAEVAARLADEADGVTDAAYTLSRPLRLRAAVIPVAGTAQDILDEAERALSEQRVQARWAGH